MMWERMRGCRCWVWCCVIVACCGVARAQPLVKLLEPLVGAEEMEQVVRMLGLEGASAEAVWALHAGYLAEYEPRARAMREVSDELTRAVKEKRPDAKEIQARFGTEFGKFVTARMDTEVSLMTDVRALLNEAELAKWPAVERMRNRATLPAMFGRSVKLWCKVDLVKMTAAAGPTELERSAIARALEEYELEVDPPLAERKKMWAEERRWSEERQREEEPRLDERNREYGERVAEITQRHYRRLMTLLGAETGARLERTVRLRVYTQVLGGPRPAMELLDAAEKLEGLSAAQRTELAGVRAVYEVESERAERGAMDACDRMDAETRRYFDMSAEEKAAYRKMEHNPMNEVYADVARVRDELELKIVARVERIVPEMREVGKKEEGGK